MVGSKTNNSGAVCKCVLEVVNQGRPTRECRRSIGKPCVLLGPEHSWYLCSWSSAFACQLLVRPVRSAKANNSSSAIDYLLAGSQQDRGNIEAIDNCLWTFLHCVMRNARADSSNAANPCLFSAICAKHVRGPSQLLQGSFSCSHALILCVCVSRLKACEWTLLSALAGGERLFGYPYLCVCGFSRNFCAFFCLTRDFAGQKILRLSYIHI